MADISQYLQAIMSAVYGEDVRGSIHDAIDIINQVSEVVLTAGTAVTGPTSSSTGFFKDSLYINTNTWDLWKCIGTDSWSLLGNVKGKDGSQWYRGTNISGKSLTPQVYPTGIDYANPNDFYLNPQEGAVYYCVTGGDPSTATWVYDFTMTGGGGASQLVDLTDVNITTPSDGQILEYDYAAGKWVNGDNISSMARYGGAKTFAELTSALLIAANVDKFYLCTDGGTILQADAGNWLLPEGSVIPPDSHIAVIEDPSTPGSYVFDDFGGYVDISGKADKTELDKFTAEVTQANGAVVFDNLDSSHGYELCYETGSSTGDLSIPTWAKVTKGSGTNSGIKLTYAISGGTDGTSKFRLRILK